MAQHPVLLLQANIPYPEGKVYCGATCTSQDSMIGGHVVLNIHTTWQHFADACSDMFLAAKGTRARRLADCGNVPSYV